MRIIWCMVPEIKTTTDRILSFWNVFCTFSSNNPKNQNFEKMKKKSLETLSFYTCVLTMYDNHMMYGSWDIECNRQDFLSFWIFFCHFIPLTNPKIKILKKWKKNPGDIILHKCSKNNDHMLYCSFTPLTTRKSKL